MPARKNFYILIGWIVFKKLLIITLAMLLYYVLNDPTFDSRLANGVVWGIAALAFFGLTGFDVVMLREDLWKALEKLKEESCSVDYNKLERNREDWG